MFVDPGLVPLAVVLCLMLPLTLTSFLVPLLNLWSHRHSVPQHQHQSNPLRFELRHLHAVSPNAHVVFSDVSPAQLKALGTDENASYTIQRTVPLMTYRPPSFNALIDARKSKWDSLKQSAAIDWKEEVIVGPDVESRETLLVLAKMTNNAYLNPGEKGWYDLGENWTTVSSCLIPRLSLLSSLRVV